MSHKQLEDFKYKGFNCTVIQYTFEKPNLSRIFLEEIGDNNWWCGYVILPKEHKFCKLHYDDIPLECHGGLTYNGDFHVPDSKNNGSYAIGFDFNHGGDYGGNKEETIQEGKNLVDQLLQEKVLL